MISTFPWSAATDAGSKRPGQRSETLLSQRTRHAFTLIELLVVISIISLLLAIMLSGLQSARRLARRTRCATNLRSLTFAVLMYAADNDEYLLVKEQGMNPYQLDLGLQFEIDQGFPDLRDMFQGYLIGFDKAAGPSPLMFCPAARPSQVLQGGRISFAAGTARWSQGHYVTGYAYWAANEENLDAIGLDWYSETDPVYRTTASPYTPLYSDPLEKRHFTSVERDWSVASHTRSAGTAEDTASEPVGQNNARLDGAVEFVRFTENRQWAEDHRRNQFGELEVCTYSLGDPDVLLLWGGRQ